MVSKPKNGDPLLETFTSDRMYLQDQKHLLTCKVMTSVTAIELTTTF